MAHNNDNKYLSEARSTTLMGEIVREEFEQVKIRKSYLIILVEISKWQSKKLNLLKLKWMIL